MVEFRMPSLGADMEAGTLVERLVKPGDRVKRGDVVAVVETQKGAIEIEVFESGQVERILVDLDTKVPVGTPLAHILTDEALRVRLARPADDVLLGVDIEVPFMERGGIERIEELPEIANAHLDGCAARSFSGTVHASGITPNRPVVDQALAGQHPGQSSPSRFAVRKCPRRIHG